MRSDIKRTIAGLKRRIKTFDRDIDTLIMADPIHATRSALITSVPGAGPQLAATMLAYLDPRQLLCPVRIDSLFL